MELLRFHVPTQAVQDPGQCGDVSGDIGVIRAVQALPHSQRAPRMRFATRVSSARVMQAAEIVMEIGDQGVIWTEMSSRGSQATSIGSGSVSETRLVLVRHAQAIEQPRSEDAMGSIDLHRVSQGVSKELLGAIVTAGHDLLGAA